MANTNIRKYDLDKMIKDLQKMMRIQDWDIIFDTCNCKQMEEITNNKDHLGFCSIHRERNTVQIFVNIEQEEYDDEWFETLLHEMFHIVVDDLGYHIDCVYDLLDDRLLAKRKQEETYVRIESLVEKLACIFINVIGKDFKEKYRIKGDIDEKNQAAK